MRQLLSDVTVLELAEGVAGDYCGKVFADLGADVIKLERPSGDKLRSHPGAFAHWNLNKRGIVGDPRSSEDRGRLWGLLGRVDLVIQTSEEGCLGDWGIEWDEIHREFPSLAVVTVSGFGASGPYSSYAWTDLIAQTFAGNLVSVGSGHMPVKLPANTALCAVGHSAAVGALAAVIHSRASGEGSFIDCAAFEALGGSPHGVLRHLAYEYRGRTALPVVANATAASGSGTLLPLGIFPCADGYVSMMTIPPQLPRMLDILDDDPLREAFAQPDGFVNPKTKEVLDAALYPWLLSRTRAEVMAACQEVSWPVTSVNLPEEVLEADHFHQRGFWVEVDDPTVGPVWVPGPLSRHAEGGWQLHRPAPTLGRDDDEVARDLAQPGPQRAGTPPTAARRSEPPLSGIRILDLTTVWSGPFATLLLADLGAEVIRLETPWVFPPSAKGFEPRPKRQMILGSIMDTYGPLVEGRPDRPYNRHAMNNSVARGKLSCSLDPRTPEARELFLRLVEKSDVVIENLKLSTIHQMGIHESELLYRNPRLLMVRLPAAGLSGDWADTTGFGAQFDALSGLTALVGPNGTEISEAPSTFHMDTVTGPAGAFAVLAGLHYREATGRGQLIEVSQSENLLHQLSDVFVDSQLGVKTERLGNRDRLFAPQGVYPCVDDRLLAISVRSDEEWSALCRTIQRSDLAGDKRFASAEGRRGAHDEIDKILTAWTTEQDCYGAFHALQQAGVPAAPLLGDQMMVDDPHVRSRNWVRPLPSRDVGTFDHLGPVFHGLPLVWKRGAPALGEHNEYVFRQILGLTAQDYERLVTEKIAVEDYLDLQGNPV